MGQNTKPPAIRLRFTICAGFGSRGTCDFRCHNIKFATPEHVVSQAIEAVAVAADRGLRERLDGVVDIYAGLQVLVGGSSSATW